MADDDDQATIVRDLRVGLEVQVDRVVDVTSLTFEPANERQLPACDQAKAMRLVGDGGNGMVDGNSVSPDSSCPSHTNLSVVSESLFLRAGERKHVFVVVNGVACRSLIDTGADCRCFYRWRIWSIDRNPQVE